MNYPSATILFLTYKQEAFVEQALLSLLAQDWPNVEIIIADDGSPDGTMRIMHEILADYRGHIRVKIFPAEVNKGLVANWNRGVTAATGEIIIAAAGDDISHSMRTRETMDYFSANPKCQALYFNCRTIDSAGQVLRNPWRQFNLAQHRSLDVPTLWKGFPFNGATAAYRTAMLRQFGPLDERCGTEDVPSLIRAQITGLATALPLVAVDWRWHGKNLSHGSSLGSRSAKLKSKLRRAKGAFYDGLQLERDAQLALTLGLRTKDELQIAMKEGRRMSHLNRLKFHVLHPAGRWGTSIFLIFRILKSPEFFLHEKLGISVKYFLRRLVPSWLRY